MDANELLDKVDKSRVFKEWREEHKDSFLAHVFIMLEGEQIADTQVGFFNPNANKMISFVVGDKEISMVPEADVLQKPGSPSVKPLDESMIQFSFENAKVKAEEVLKEKYETLASKKIFILQKIEDDQLWNITFLTNKFSTVNIMIDSESGQVLKDEEVNLIDMNKSS